MKIASLMNKFQSGHPDLLDKSLQYVNHSERIWVCDLWLAGSLLLLSFCCRQSLRSLHRSGIYGVTSALKRFDQGTRPSKNLFAPKATVLMA